MHKTNPLYRSQLGIPGNEKQLVSNALNTEADEIFLDLEDSLAPGEKESARADIISIVEDEEWTDTGLGYRINGTDTRWWYEDIIEVLTAVGSEIDCIIVPKVTTPADLETVANLVQSVETNTGLPVGSVTLRAQIETATGMNAVMDIAHASQRLTAMMFGPADYAASIGAAHGAIEYPGHYWHYPLSRISHAAASAGLLAIGGPYTDADDSEGFYEACRAERALGYDGKVVIHPDQVEAANSVFSPTIEEAHRAHRIVQQYEAADENDVAAIDGKVIDEEMYRIGEQILSKAKAAGLL
ncbi:CoA ester lyase [Haloarcula sp. S1CR25-12]|uniref:CoA ester lyase n=1 Tax=Haloarcula saliterrae TaxID=2950534 RepID=A0ABU2FFW3_9EURY|nr:CoA ester lyase [Haloarcula sp. S1CR25-12]MDS0261129.1 CoA ester lyase [Haloarcula sp. S1CR25-12]